MAYAALVSLSRTIEQFLNHDEYSISLPQKQHMISIHEYVIFLQVFLEDVPHEVDNTLGGRIRDAANQAEDVIEYFTWRQIQSRYPLIKSKITKPNEVRFQDDHPKRNLYRDYSELDQVVELMGIMNQSRFKEMKLGDSGVVASSSSSRTSPSYKNDAMMVGLNDDLLAIKERLCGEASKLQVIPIVGMGGIGKTALATNAYLDPLIIEHFHIRAWVTVSKDYSAQRIVSDLLSCMKEFNTERSYQSNEEKVYKALKGRKYLIVMDDMWSTQAWDDVRRIFPDDDNGSRILLTTRLSDVAAYADSCSHLHEMHLMDSDQSWDLLRQKVFKQEELCPLELEDTGKAIARSCIGLPLAIVVIAGLLSSVSRTRASWEEIAENVTSTIATENGQLEKIMSLSYTHLPHHLRPCFLYMGAFPEDHVVHVSKLVKLWVAEGFLKYPNGSKSLEEEVAEEYLEELVKRSLVLVSKRKSSGKIKSCKLHDLVRELCIRKAHQEKFLLHVMDSRVPENVVKDQRHVSINQYGLDCLANIYGSTIHTLICFLSAKWSDRYIEHFILLRVFDLVSSHFNPYDVETGPRPAKLLALYHLRYLAFNYHIEIPPTISNLQNLQTLIISPKFTLRYVKSLPCQVHLPSKIWRMPQLRHLVCYNFGELPINREERGRESTCALKNLQTLSAVTNLRCSVRILKMIPNVKKLGLFYPDGCKDGDGEGYHFENLVLLQQLEKLKLTNHGRFSYWTMEVVPTFPKTLKKLTLECWRLKWGNMRPVGLLPNLQVLKLKCSSRVGNKWETSEGEFPQLKYLLMENSPLKYWITESSHFRSRASRG